MEHSENNFRDKANKIANENQISAEERELFLEYYTKFFISDENEKKQLENFEWWEDNVIGYFNKFINVYKEVLSINLGHEESAKEYARSVSFDDHTYHAWAMLMNPIALLSCNGKEGMTACTVSYFKSKD